MSEFEKNILKLILSSQLKIETVRLNELTRQYKAGIIHHDTYAVQYSVQFMVVEEIERQLKELTI